MRSSMFVRSTIWPKSTTSQNQRYHTDKFYVGQIVSSLAPMIARVRRKGCCTILDFIFLVVFIAFTILCVAVVIFTIRFLVQSYQNNHIVGSHRFRGVDSISRSPKQSRFSRISVSSISSDRKMSKILKTETTNERTTTRIKNKSIHDQNHDSESSINQPPQRKSGENQRSNQTNMSKDKKKQKKNITKNDNHNENNIEFDRKTQAYGDDQSTPTSLLGKQKNAENNNNNNNLIGNSVNTTIDVNNMEKMFTEIKVAKIISPSFDINECERLAELGFGQLDGATWLHIEIDFPNEKDCIAGYRPRPFRSTRYTR